MEEYCGCGSDQLYVDCCQEKEKTGRVKSPKNKFDFWRLDPIGCYKLCHWAFDEGVMGVSENYNVITSRQIAANPNVPGFLLTLNGRSIIPPLDHDLWPAQQYLAEHQRE